MDRPNKNICRPSAINGVVSVVFVMAGMLTAWLCTQPNSHQPHGISLFSPLPLALFGFMTLIAIPYSYKLIFHSINWDDEGFSWRTIRGTQQAHWTDIANYGVQQNANNTAPSCRIVLSDGRTLQFSTDWDNAVPLVQAVQQRASAASVQKWTSFDARPTTTK